MSYAAFVYDDHYCRGIADSFAGVYDSREEAKQRVRGDRWNHENLEIMNLKTFGITCYRWVPLYNFESKRGGPSSNDGTLTHSWSKDMPVIELVWDGEVRRYGHNNPFFDAGEWRPAGET
jgi:hypothetical protein